MIRTSPQSKVAVGYRILGICLGLLIHGTLVAQEGAPIVPPKPPTPPPNKELVQQQNKHLRDALDSWQQEPSLATFRKGYDAAAWLAENDVTSQPLDDARAAWKEPAIQFHISDALLQEMTRGNVRESFDVNDRFAGYPVTGNGTLTGKYSLDPISNGTLNWHFRGTSSSQTTAYASEAIVYQRSTTSIDAQFPIAWDQGKFVLRNSRVVANANVQPYSAQSRMRRGSNTVVQRAMQNARANSSRAERDSEAKTEAYIRRRMGDEVRQEVARLNQAWSSLWSRVLSNESDAPKMNLSYRDASTVASLDLPPPYPGSPQVQGIRGGYAGANIHEIGLEYLCHDWFAGESLTGQELEERLDGEKASEKAAPPEEQLLLTFADSFPVQFEFEKNELTLHAHFTQLRTPKGTLDNVIATVTYRLEGELEKEWNLVRVDKPKIENKEDTSSRNVRELIIRRVALNLLDRDIPTTIDLTPLSRRLLDEMEIDQPLVPQMAATKEGWLQIWWYF